MYHIDLIKRDLEEQLQKTRVDLDSKERYLRGCREEQEALQDVLRHIKDSEDSNATAAVEQGVDKIAKNIERKLDEVLSKMEIAQSDFDKVKVEVLSLEEVLRRLKPLEDSK